MNKITSRVAGKKMLFAASVILLMAAGCNSSQPASVTSVAQASPTPTPMVTPTATATQAQSAPMMTPTPTQTTTQATVVLKLATDPTLGQYLTAANGMTLYTSSADSANMSKCSGSCATNWPAYTAAAGLKLGAMAGISGALGTITRADGTTQVTYKGMPLYFWVNDAKAGDTTGQGIGGFAVAKP